MKKATIFLADGFEEVEALTVVDLLRRADVEVAMTSITDDLKVTGSKGISVLADVTIAYSKWEEADMIVLPGGMPGTTNLNECIGVRDAVNTFAELGKPVAAICAAPAVVLGQNGLLAGKKATCYPGMESFFEGAEASTEPVVRDMPFITSRGVGTAIPFALALIEELLGRAKADEIAESIVFAR